MLTGECCVQWSDTCMEFHIQHMCYRKLYSVVLPICVMKTQLCKALVKLCGAATCNPQTQSTKLLTTVSKHACDLTFHIRQVRVDLLQALGFFSSRHTQLPNLLRPAPLAPRRHKAALAATQFAIKHLCNSPASSSCCSA